MVHPPSMLHCPNCGAPASSAERTCLVCGYAPGIAREYFWLYGGGLLLILLGFALGGVGVAVQGAAPGHWSGSLEGWYPLAPWPASHHWLSFLVAGIILTLAGMGITRRRASGWLAFAGLAAWQAAACLLAALGLAGSVHRGPARWAPWALLALEAALLLLAARIGLAFRRTPRRDPRRIHERISAVERGETAR